MSQDHFQQLATLRKAKAKPPLSRDYFHERVVFASKRLNNLRKVYALSISLLGTAMAEVTAHEEQSEYAFAIIRFGELAERMNVSNWPMMSITELLHPRFPKHHRIERVFNELRIRTILGFCKTDLQFVKNSFFERGVELPLYFEILHSAYRHRP